MKRTKAEWEEILRKRTLAFPKIANTLGKEHPVTKMMGPLAWGRHSWEHGPDYGLQDVIVAASALDGVFDTLNLWCRDNDLGAQRTLIQIYAETRR